MRQFPDDKLTITINESSKLVQGDIQASKGRVHLIDTVLIPDSLGTILDAVKKRSYLKEFSNAATAAGLDETLETKKNITVFAPSSFELGSRQLPPGTDIIYSLKEHILNQV